MPSPILKAWLYYSLDKHQIVAMQGAWAYQLFNKSAALFKGTNQIK